MNKEEIIGKNLIPDGFSKQIVVSEEKDENCLIWISPKAINMANEIDYIRQAKSNLYKFINSKEYEEQFESKSNALYIKAKIKNIFGFTMSIEEFEILKGDSNE